MTYRRNPRRQQDGSGDALARGLGWFSIALGVAELAAPKSLGRALGLEHRSGLLQAYGLREIATGVGLLAARDPTPWIWGRVAGDALDLLTLAPGLGDDNPDERARVGAAMGAVAAVTLLDLYCARQFGASAEPPRPIPDYSDRSGFPDTPERMRGAARR